jgi:hypothetical protein
MHHPSIGSPSHWRLILAVVFFVGTILAICWTLSVTKSRAAHAAIPVGTPEQEPGRPAGLEPRNRP